MSTENTTPRVRPLKAVVQFVFVVDENDALQELTTAPVTVPVHLWPSFVERAFDDARDQVARQIESERGS